MRTILAVAGSLLLLTGCESSAPSNVTQKSTSAPAPPSPAAPSDKVDSQPKQAKAVDAAGKQLPATKAPAAKAPAAPAETPADDAQVKKAEVGVGTKGKDYEPGFITTPIAAKFRTEERIAFEVQIPSAMKLYKAEHNNKGPKTHDEFMDVIIKEHGVALPDLAPGESFVYDPATEELLVKSPKQ